MGIRRGWAGLVDLVPDPAAENDEQVIELTESVVNRIGRTGGTFLHTSRTRPSRLPQAVVPEHLRGEFQQEINDVTPAVLRHLEFLGIDYLVPIDPDDEDWIEIKLRGLYVLVMSLPEFQVH